MDKFEYWRELLLVILMLTVLILGLTMFDTLSPSGEDGARATVSILTG